MMVLACLAVLSCCLLFRGRSCRAFENPENDLSLLASASHFLRLYVDDALTILCHVASWNEVLFTLNLQFRLTSCQDYDYRSDSSLCEADGETNNKM